nr:hypothetical protein [Tanacetum cinerariifolium]
MRASSLRMNALDEKEFRMSKPKLLIIRKWGEKG